MTNIPRRPSRNQLRIIGGKWRGRKLDFPSAEGLRPTGDRIRETLFNWLMPVVPGARCLDLFAGSGALGLEALSRGAAELVMLDTDLQVVKTLQQHCQRLAAENATIQQSDATEWLRRTEPGSGFDIVFVDPPFQSELLQPSTQLLAERGFLKEGALIYVEIDRQQRFIPPSHWQLFKHQLAGQISFSLYRHSRRGTE